MDIVTAESIADLDDLDSCPRRVVRLPAHVLWLGSRRQVLTLYVHVLEQVRDGIWRQMCELKAHQWSVRQDHAALRALARAKRVFKMSDQGWRISNVEYGDDRFACQYECPGEFPRRIECILKKKTPALTAASARKLVSRLNRLVRENGATAFQEADAKTICRKLLVNGWGVRQFDFRKAGERDYFRLAIFRVGEGCRGSSNRHKSLNTKRRIRS